MSAIAGYRTIDEMGLVGKYSGGIGEHDIRHRRELRMNECFATHRRYDRHLDLQDRRFALIKRSLDRLTDAVDRNGMITNGLGTILTDQLHSYEEGINARGEDAYLADGNAVIAAYQGPRKTKDELAKTAETRQGQFKLRYSLPSLVAEARRLDGGGPAIDPKAKIFTDDFAPAEALKAIEKHNRQWPSPAAQP